MSLIQKLVPYHSLAIVGMAKNTGKTTCLNYVMEALYAQKRRLGITSIGVDGEERDVLYDTPKPRIYLRKGMVFSTSERHFKERAIDAEILHVSTRHTALGPLIRAKALSDGQVIISGPSDTLWLKEEIEALRSQGADLCLIDGALSRLSLASPSVSEGLILTTGAACASQIDELIRKTKHVCRLIGLKACEPSTQIALKDLEKGIYVRQPNGPWQSAPQTTAFVDKAEDLDWLTQTREIYLNGVLTDAMVQRIIRQASEYRFILNDFTRCFVQAPTLDKFLRRGGRLEVKDPANLVAICSNPTSPSGYRYDPIRLRDTLAEALELPVYDIVIEKNNIHE